MGSREWLGSVTLRGCSESPASIRFSQLCLGVLEGECGVPGFGSVALKALSQSVLVKRADLALIRCPPAFDQRLAVQCWAGNGLGKQVLGFGSAVAGVVRQARQSVLVKSFSGSCNAPLPPFCDPGARLTLNGWGVFRA